MSHKIEEAPFDTTESPGVAPRVVESDVVVMKFGGTSVDSAANWHKISALIRNRLDSGLRPVVVHSALSKVTNELQQILATALGEDPQAQIDALRQRHYSLAEELELDGPALLDESFAELERLVAGVRLVREVSPRMHAHVVGMGELMATKLGAAFLKNAGAVALGVLLLRWDAWTAVGRAAGANAAEPANRAREKPM